MELRVKRAENFSPGGGQNCLWGGTQNFLDGGGQALMGGDYPSMGGGPPPSPPILASPELPCVLQAASGLKYIIEVTAASSLF